jgi:hypothetical protein
VAIVALLAGCAPQHTTPEGLSDAEVKAIYDAQQLQMWESYHQGETPPDVEFVRYLDPESGSVRTECMAEANIPGFSVTEEGWWSFQSTDLATDRLFADAQYICALKYPPDPSNSDQMGLFSDAELDFIYHYMTDRLVPCVRLMGYSLREVPTRDAFMSSSPYLGWSVYDAMLPLPQSIEEWGRVDARCPPSPVGQFWRAGLDYLSP